MVSRLISLVLTIHGGVVGDLGEYLFSDGQTQGFVCRKEGLSASDESL